MPCMAVLGFVLCILIQGINSSPGRRNPGRDWFQWGLSGSRNAPGIALSSHWTDAGSRDVSDWSPVTMQCQEAAMVVTVQRDLFGTGKLIQAADLRLGAAFCKYTILNANNTITFQIALQDCGNTLQVTPDSLIYSSILTYNPTPPIISTVITRTNPTSVLVRCVYPRNRNVSSNAIKPTWVPFSSTIYAEQSLYFSLTLMNGDWSSARNNSTFQLGDVFNIEASVQTGSHVNLRVFVDSCVATLNLDMSSSPRYDIIGNNGCLLDGKLADSSSAFVAPRDQLDKLRFTVDAFRFIADTRSQIYITCNLKVVPAVQDPSPTSKACSYSKTVNGWLPVEGQSGICRCCDAVNCGARRKRGIFPELAAEASTAQFAILGPLTIQGQKALPSIIEEEVEMKTLKSASVEDPWMVLGLILVVSAVMLSLVVLGAVMYKRRLFFA
ncbi:zona pellucida sperm-binding protein 3-like [Lissotriton helveticus]